MKKVYAKAIRRDVVTAGHQIPGNISTGRQPFNLTEYVYGEVAEWSNAADSKSVVPLVGTGSSNLPLSAKSLKDEKNDRYGRQPAGVRWPIGHDVRRTVPEGDA